MKKVKEELKMQAALTILSFGRSTHRKIMRKFKLRLWKPREKKLIKVKLNLESSFQCSTFVAEAEVAEKKEELLFLT